MSITTTQDTSSIKDVYDLIGGLNNLLMKCNKAKV
jgi:hypothetical protein